MAAPPDDTPSKTAPQPSLAARVRRLFRDVTEADLPVRDIGPVAIAGGLAIVAAWIVAGLTGAVTADLQITPAAPDVPAENDLGAITAIAWTTVPGGPLVVGTDAGFLYTIRRDGTPVFSGTPPTRYAPGRIVTIHPSETDATAEAVWADPSGGEEPFRAGADATFRGFAFRLDGALIAVPIIARARFADSKNVAQQTQQAPGNDIYPLTALSIPPQAPGERPIAVSGYADGSVSVTGRSALSVVPTGSQGFVDASGPVVALASGSPSALVTGYELAAAFEDGSVNLWRSAIVGPLPLDKRQAEPATFDLSTPTAPGTARSHTGPLSRPDGLRMDSAGRVLLLWDQVGAVWIARVAADGTATFRPYPLDGIPRTTPERSTKAIQEALKAQGFYDGAIDGLEGIRTQMAMAAFLATTGADTSAGSPRADERLLPTVVSTTDVVLSPRGDLFAAASGDGRVIVVVLPADPTAAPATAKTISVLGHRAPVVRMAISPDGARLATLDAAGELILTDVDRLLTLAAIPLTDLSATPGLTDLPPVRLDPLPAAAAVDPTGGGSSTVFLQFAGSYTRQTIIDAAARLRALGWDNLQGADKGGERTPSAAGVNEIRFGSEADRSAAERLAADVNGLGLDGPKVSVAGPNPAIKEGVLEIWISN